MHKEMLREVVKRCKQRQREGDCPTVDAFSAETLEDAVIQLSSWNDDLGEQLMARDPKMLPESRELLRQKIVSDIMKLLPGVLEPTDRKPTVEELEKILNSEDAERISINPDGSIGQYRPAKVGDVADAVMKVVTPYLKE